LQSNLGQAAIEGTQGINPLLDKQLPENRATT
jgi:hypothetical protein